MCVCVCLCVCVCVCVCVSEERHKSTSIGLGLGYLVFCPVFHFLVLCPLAFCPLTFCPGFDFGLHRGNLRATTTISDIYAIPIAFYCQADN